MYKISFFIVIEQSSSHLKVFSYPHIFFIDLHIVYLNTNFFVSLEQVIYHATFSS